MHAANSPLTPNEATDSMKRVRAIGKRLEGGMTAKEQADADRLYEFLRPGIEAKFIRESCVDKPYKTPRIRPTIEKAQEERGA